MRRTGQRLLVAAATLATAAVFIPAVPAAAASVATVVGGCGFNTTGSAFVAGANQQEGVIYDLSMAQESNGLPLDATVLCWIDVNGVQQPGTRISATDDTVPGVEFNSAQIAFTAYQTDVVSECEQVSLPAPWVWLAPDGNTYSSTQAYCPAATELTVPPQGVSELINTITTVLSPELDPTLCPIFSSLGATTGGGVLGTVLIEPDGDIYVAQLSGRNYNQVYDCAPYGNGRGLMVPGPTTTYESLPPTF